MKYEFHVGDYIELRNGKFGYLIDGKTWYSENVHQDVICLQANITSDVNCKFIPFTMSIPFSDVSKHVNRIGQYDFTKHDFTKPELKSIKRLPVDLLARGKYITTKALNYNGEFVKASYSRELIDKINELVEAVNELQEDYNTHLEIHKQHER